MARGLQKLQSKVKGQERNAASKKPTTQKGTEAAGLKYTCAVCKAQLPDTKTYKQHFENKHAGKELPGELKEVAQ